MDQPDITDFRYKVLSQIYYHTNKGTSPVIAHKLANIAGLPWEPFIQAVQYLDKHLLVYLHPDGQAIWMTPRGIAELEKPGTPHFAVTHNTTNVNAPNLGNIQTGGSSNTQTITVNPDFDEAINNLLEFVRVSSLTVPDKEELTDEVVKIQALALKEPAPGLLDKIKARLNIVKTALTTAGLMVKAGPYLKTIWEYFKLKYNL